LESKSSDLATPSHLDQFCPNLKVWTPTRLNLMALEVNREYQANLGDWFTLRLVNSTTPSHSWLRRGISPAISVMLLPSLPRRGWGWLRVVVR